jgi:hypothetical protein
VDFRLRSVLILLFCVVQLGRAKDLQSHTNARTLLNQAYRAADNLAMLVEMSTVEARRADTVFLKVPNRQLVMLLADGWNLDSTICNLPADSTRSTGRTGRISEFGMDVGSPHLGDSTTGLTLTATFCGISGSSLPLKLPMPESVRSLILERKVPHLSFVIARVNLQQPKSMNPLAGKGYTPKNRELLGTTMSEGSGDYALQAADFFKPVEQQEAEEQAAVIQEREPEKIKVLSGSTFGPGTPPEIDVEDNAPHTDGPWFGPGMSRSERE